jgi:hypothetical protein
MIYLMVGLVGGLISALIANGKGRNVLGWGVAGFFFPLIATLILVVAAPIAKPEELEP